MAYENQDKCVNCGISIPHVHELSDHSAYLCDDCYEASVLEVHNISNQSSLDLISSIISIMQQGDACGEAWLTSTKNHMPVAINMNDYSSVCDLQSDVIAKSFNTVVIDGGSSHGEEFLLIFSVEDGTFTLKQ